MARPKNPRKSPIDPEGGTERINLTLPKKTLDVARKRDPRPGKVAETLRAAIKIGLETDK